MGKQIRRSALRARPSAATASRALRRVITISMPPKIENVPTSDELKPSELHKKDKKETLRVAGIGVASVGPRYNGLMTMHVSG
jgi:predicted DNA-binding helix-hairpin-helix protein